MMPIPGRHDGIVVGFLLIIAARASAGPLEELLPPAVKPVASRRVEIKPWEASSDSPFGGFRMGGQDQRAFAISPDGRMLASEDAGGWQVELWDLTTGKSLARFGKINTPVAFAFTPDGKTLITTSHSPTDLPQVTAWGVSARKGRSLDEDVNTTAFSAAAVTPDGKSLILASSTWRRGGTGDVHLWDLATGDEVRKFERATAPQNEPAVAAGESVAVAPDGKSVAMVVGERVTWWEMATGKDRMVLGRLPSSGRGNRGEMVHTSIAFSPDGRTLAVGYFDGAVRFWELPTGRELPPIQAHKGAVRCIRFTADGKSLLSFGEDNELLTWPAVQAEWKPGLRPLAPEVVVALWDSVTSKDLRVRHGAIRALASRPEQVITFLRGRVKPVPAIPNEQITRAVMDFNQPDYNTRKHAAADLRRFGDLALPLLRQNLAAKAHDPAMGRLIERIEENYPTPAQVHALRAIDVLETAATDDARRFLGELAKGAEESIVTQHASAALERLTRPAGGEVGQQPLSKRWEALEVEDAAKALLALRALVVNPKEAVPFLREKLGKAAGAFDDSPERVVKLLAELDSDDFATREAATETLEKLGPGAEPALQKALGDKPSLEKRQRLMRILGKVRQAAPPGDHLRTSRGIEALELIGTEEAREALRSIEKEAKNRWIKQGAGDAARRLAARRP